MKSCACCLRCCVNWGSPDECGNYIQVCLPCNDGTKLTCDEPCPERPPCLLQCVEIGETPCGDPVYDCPVYDTEIIGIPVESCEECPDPPPCDEYYCCYAFEPSQNPESPLPPRNCQIGPCSAPELYSSGPHPTLVQCAAACENWYCCYTEQPSQNPEVPLPPSACQLGPCDSIELQRSGPHYTLQKCQESCQDYYCCYDEQPSGNPEIPLPSSTCQVGPCAAPELYNSGPHMSLAACQANCKCTCDAFYSDTLTYTYNENTGDLGPFCSFVYVRGQQLFTIPAHIPLPARVVLTGSVNDDLVLNGKVVQEGLFPFGGNPCNGAHDVNYCFTATSRTFTLATKDNYGFGMSAAITIQFCRECDAEYAIFLCNSNAQRDNPYDVSLNGQQIGTHVLRADGTIDGEFWVTDPDITLDMLSCANCDACAEDDPWMQSQIALPPDFTELIDNPDYVVGKDGFDLSNAALCKDCIGQSDPAVPTEIRLLQFEKALLNENGNNTLTLVNSQSPAPPGSPGAYGRLWVIKFRKCGTSFTVDSIALSTAYSDGDPNAVFSYEFILGDNPLP